MSTNCYFCQAALTADICAQCGQPQVLRGVYRLTGLIAQGGFGTVYRAADVRFPRDYAIKIIYAPSAAEQRQIQTEAALLATLAGKLACVPEIYDAWSEGSRTVLVMEYVAGLTLTERVEQQGPLGAADVETVLRTLLEHLGNIHAEGVVHRDIKPDNIKQRPNGTLVLLDFGIARHGNVTRTAARAMTPHYSAPEQILGQPTAARTDLYSLGATLYFLATGQAPPSAELRQALQQPLPLLEQFNHDTSPALQRFIERLMELDATERPSDASTALAEWEHIGWHLSQSAAHLRIDPAPLRPITTAGYTLPVGCLFALMFGPIVFVLLLKLISLP